MHYVVYVRTTTYLTLRKLKVGISNPVVTIDGAIRVDTLDSLREKAFGDQTNFHGFCSCKGGTISYGKLFNGSNSSQ